MQMPRVHSNTAAAATFTVTVRQHKLVHHGKNMEGTFKQKSYTGRECILMCQVTATIVLYL